MKHSVQTRQRILDAACMLFAEHGYDAVTIRAIAERAKSKLGSIYYYFDSKESLYVEVFRQLYDLKNALTYDVLLEKEPMVLDTPDGKAYAIQRIMFDYFRRHVFAPEEWKRKLIVRELFDHSPIFFRLVEEVLKDESEKMTRFYFLLSPNASMVEAYYWSHLPDTQGLYYLMASGAIEQYFDHAFMEELGRTIVKRTTCQMISMLGLPVPEMLK